MTGHVLRAAVVAHIVVVVALLVAVSYWIGYLPALVLAAVVTVAWVVWAREVHEDHKASQLPPMPVGSPRFRAPEDDETAPDGAGVVGT